MYLINDGKKYWHFRYLIGAAIFQLWQRTPPSELCSVSFGNKVLNSNQLWFIHCDEL